MFKIGNRCSPKPPVLGYTFLDLTDNRSQALHSILMDVVVTLPLLLTSGEHLEDPWLIVTCSSPYYVRKFARRISRLLEPLSWSCRDRETQSLIRQLRFQPILEVARRYPTARFFFFSEAFGRCCSAFSALPSVKFPCCLRVTCLSIGSGSSEEFALQRYG